MRNLKKLLAVIVSVCVLATFTFPAFAAEKTAAEICEDLGVLKGDSSEGVTDTYLAKGTTRDQAAILYLRLIGKEDEAYAFEGEDNFADADQTWDNAKKALAYLKANPELGWQGVSEDKFDPKAQISAQQMYKVCLEALGYKQGVDFEWADVFTFAAEKGLTLIADVTEMTNNDLAIALVEALKLPLKDSKTTLIEDLVAKGVVTEAAAIAAGLIEAEPEELKVVSVEADNLKQFVVTFNKAVDEDSAEDLGNYDLDADKADLTDATAALADDGKTVTITLDDGNEAKFEEEATLIVSGVEDKDENKMKEQEIEFVFNDVDFPTVVSAKVVGNDTIKVVFSEPITNASVEDDEDDFVVDGGDYIIEAEDLMNNNTEINITLYSNLEEGDIELKVLNTLEDYAGYNVAKKTLTVTVVKDEDPPVIVGYENAKNTEVTLIFDNDIEINDEDEDNFYHTNEKNVIGDDDGNFEEDVDYKLDGNKLTLKFTENPLPDGTAYVYIAKDAINDLWDNKNAKLVYKIEIEEDETAPTLKDIDTDGQQKIVLTFSEEIAEDSIDEDSFTLLDSDGKVKDLVRDVDYKTNDLGADLRDKLVVEFKEKLDGKYTIIIEDLEDDAGNEIAKITKEFTMKDETQPVHTDFEVTLYKGSAKGQMLKVDFDQKMALDGKYSVLDPEKYVLDIAGEEYDLSDIDAEVKITAINDGKAVEIRIDSEADDEDDGIDIPTAATLGIIDGVTLTIARVADAAGNYTKQPSATLVVNAPSTVGFKAEATANDTIVVTFEDLLKKFDKTEFAIYSDDNDNGDYDDGVDTLVQYSKLKTGTNKDGNTTVTYSLTGDNKMAYNATTTPSAYNLYVLSDVSGTEKSENKYGEEVKDGEYVEVADKIAPALAEIADRRGDKVDAVEVVYNGSKAAKVNDSIILTFRETLDITSISTGTFVVDGGDYKVVSVAFDDSEYGVNSVVILTVKNDDNDNLEGVSVVQEAALRDFVGNVVKGISTDVGDFGVYPPTV